MRAISLMSVGWLALTTACGPKKPPEGLTAEGAATTAGAANVSQSVGSPTEPAGAVSPVSSTPAPDPQVQAQVERKLLEQKADDAVAFLTTGNIDDARKAINLLSSLEDELPEQAVVPFNLGLAYEILGQTDAARQAFRRATMRDPTLGVAWVKLGLIEESAGNLAGALTQYRTGIERSPEDIDLRVATVAVLMRMGRYDEAAEAAKEALNINSNALSIYSNLGLVYIEQGKLDLAKFIFQKALNSIDGAENNAHVHAYLGRIYYLQGYTFDARKELERALELDPDLVPAMVYLSEYYLDNRAFDDIVPLLERARVLAPEDIAVRMNLGVAYRGLERYEEAEKEYEAVRNLDPRKSEPYINLAILYGDYLKSYEKAIDVLEKYKQMPGADIERADQWIAEVQKERERTEKQKKRREAAEEARRKREEERRFLEEFERKQREEEEQRKRLEEQGLTPEGAPVPGLDADGAVPGGGAGTQENPHQGAPAASPDAGAVEAPTDPAGTSATDDAGKPQPPATEEDAQQPAQPEEGAGDDSATESKTPWEFAPAPGADDGSSQ